MERKNAQERINTTLNEKRINEERESSEEFILIVEWKDKEKEKNMKENVETQITEREAVIYLWPVQEIKDKIIEREWWRDVNWSFTELKKDFTYQTKKRTELYSGKIKMGWTHQSEIKEGELFC